MSKAELQPQAIKIDKAITRIEAGDIKIPAFQRGFVWDQEQVLELLDSIYHNYPIGSVLVWCSHEKLKATRNVAGLEIPDQPPEYPVNYVLDGQQRLSTVYGVFAKVRTPAQIDPTYTVDLNVFDISFDFQSAAFVPTGDAKSAGRRLRLSVLFDTDQLFPAMEKLNQDDRKVAQDLYSRFSNYELPVVTISGRSKDEVGTIFERINSTGTRLTTLDLMVAWTWSEEFHLQSEINQLLDVLESKSFGDVSERIVLQALSAMLDGSTTTKTILGLKPDLVRSRFPELQASFERATDFLSTHLKVSSLELLPHLQQLVPLVVFFSKVPTPSAAQADLLTKWFWLTSFSRRYASQTDEKMDEDVKTVLELADKNVVSLSRYSYTVDSKTLIRQVMTKQSPVARAFLLLLAQRGPLDLTNGLAVDTGKALSGYNRKEYHHVFPRNFLRQRGVPTDKVNSICNFCFLPSGSNKKISSRAPSDYFFSIIPEERRKDILDSNVLPLKLDVYQKDSYEDFIEGRAQLALQYLDRLVS
jgi:hypothetical protein